MWKDPVDKQEPRPVARTNNRRTQPRNPDPADTARARDHPVRYSLAVAPRSRAPVGAVRRKSNLVLATRRLGERHTPPCRADALLANATARPGLPVDWTDLTCY